MSVFITMLENTSVAEDVGLGCSADIKFNRSSTGTYGDDDDDDGDVIDNILEYSSVSKDNKLYSTL